MCPTPCSQREPESGHISTASTAAEAQGVETWEGRGEGTNQIFSRRGSKRVDIREMKDERADKGQEGRGVQGVESKVSVKMFPINGSIQGIFWKGMAGYCRSEGRTILPPLT